MTGSRVNIENFGGELPRRSDRLLPESFATKAYNVKLKSGEIRGMHRLKQLHDFSDRKVVKSYRLPDDTQPEGFTWLGLTSRDIEVFRGPLLNDKYDRYYMFGDGAPRYNTLERIRNDDPWYKLGVPSPTAPPTIFTTAGNETTRAYVYTFVSEFGEESAPSPPETKDGLQTEPWIIGDMETTVPNFSERSITRKRIYRTVAGFSTAAFFLVAEIDLTQVSYTDTEEDVDVSRNSILESTNWNPPPEGVTGAVMMPNGFFLGWAGRDIHFCETYRPHAWPAIYDLSAEYDVVGAGVFGQSAGVITEGTPYIASGATPASTTLTKTATSEPGLGRHSIVSLPYGVVYASQNGLVMLSAAGLTNPTLNIITKNEWVNEFSPETLWAAQYESQYMGFYQHDRGLVIDPQDQMANFVELTVFKLIDFVQTDVHTGETFVMSLGKVHLWDAVEQPRVEYQWRSKSFEFPKPCNLGAAIVEMEAFTDDDWEMYALIQKALAYNRERLTHPLDTMGSTGLGMVNPVPLGPPFGATTQDKQTFGGSPLLNMPGGHNQDYPFVRLKVYADERLVFSGLSPLDIHIRLPSGFKARHWAFEVLGETTVLAIKAAETGKGLADV